MPVLTRSKRKLLNTDSDPSVYSECLISLMDITKPKRKKINNNDPPEKSKMQESTISQQNTVLIPLEIALGAAASQKSNVTKRHESALDISQYPTQKQSQTQIDDAGVIMMRKIKKMLENNFKNIAERLQLDPVPACLHDLRNCHDHHSKSPVLIASVMVKNTAMGYLRAERLFQLLHYVRHNMCGQRLFPGADILINILQKIMKLAPSTTDHLKTSFVLTEFHSLFMTILNLFPPCQIREQYFQILRSPFRIEGIRVKKQLLPSILEQLDDLIFLNEANYRKSLAMEDDYALNYYIWEQQARENVDFKKLSRNNRFERLFLILDIIVRILEYDASIFIIKHSHKFASSIANDKIKPLICSVIWQDFESVIVINATIKQLISIFVAMNALQYSTEKIQIVSRLLSLVGNVINMYEYPDDTFEYPTYKNFSIDFAREIQRNIENSNYNSLDLYHSVTENIRSPLIRMLLASFMLTKITKETMKPSLSIPFNSIRLHEVNSFLNVPTAKHSRGTEQYPIHDAKKKLKQCKIAQSDFLRLLLIYAESVNSYYRISSALIEIKKTETTPSSSSIVKDIKPAEAFDNKKFKESIKHVDLNEKVCLRQIDLNFKKMVHIRLTKEACSFYRNEIKNLLLLIKIIKCYHQKYGAKLDDWLKFIQKIEAET